LAAVDKVDQAMCKVRDAGKIKARDRIAVLAALNLAFEQAESSSSPETQTAKPPLQTAAFNDADNDRLGHLLKKLDQALHKDGQLI
jgi:cell division protein ZapA